jgi:two-component system sensor histidine kinase ChvG
LLERTPHPAPQDAVSERPEEARSRPLTLLRRAWQFFTVLTFSSLTRRIVSLNVIGLVALVIGILYLSQFRAGLIDARIQSLLVQGEIIAGAIAASATADMDSVQIDPDRLLELRAGESYGPTDESLLEFPINPERVGPLLRRLVSPTKTRARIYDRDGGLILDSRNLDRRGDVLRFDLPSPTAEKPAARGWAAATFRPTANSGRKTAWAIRKSRSLSRVRRPAWCA